MSEFDCHSYGSVLSFMASKEVRSALAARREAEVIAYALGRFGYIVTIDRGGDLWRARFALPLSDAKAS